MSIDNIVDSGYLSWEQAWTRCSYASVCIKMPQTMWNQKKGQVWMTTHNVHNLQIHGKTCHKSIFGSLVLNA